VPTLYENEAVQLIVEGHINGVVVGVLHIANRRSKYTDWRHCGTRGFINNRALQIRRGQQAGRAVARVLSCELVRSMRHVITNPSNLL
jgi:hypothetical protein